MKLEEELMSLSFTWKNCWGPFIEVRKEVKGHVLHLVWLQGTVVSKGVANQGIVEGVVSVESRKRRDRRM